MGAKIQEKEEAKRKAAEEKRILQEQIKKAEEEAAREKKIATEKAKQREALEAKEKYEKERKRREEEESLRLSKWEEKRKLEAEARAKQNGARERKRKKRLEDDQERCTESKPWKSYKESRLPQLQLLKIIIRNQTTKKIFLNMKLIQQKLLKIKDCHHIMQSEVLMLGIRPQ